MNFLNYLILFMVAAIAESTLLECTNPIYCKGAILDHVSKYKIFEDSKTFVDMKLVKSQDETISDFDKLLQSTNNNPSKADIVDFVSQHFVETDEFENWTPPDYNPTPEFLDQIRNETIRSFAQGIVTIWKNLTRKIKDEVKKNPERYSLIPLPNGFVIPGGRFKEIYYWDSYWVIQGLLISGMTETVKGIIENFSTIIQQYGFFPNGNRIYYLDRSQPPLFTLMVHAYVTRTNDLDFLRNQLHVMDKELRFWIHEKTVKVNKNGRNYMLAHYISGSHDPRPESYREDMDTCSVYKTDEERSNCYHELKSGAETGWDFSSRWMVDKSDKNEKNSLTSIRTTKLIPVDLNAFLCQDFRLLKEMYQMVGNNSRAKFWEAQENGWKKGIENVLFDKETGVWYDYCMESHSLRKIFFPSNIFPLGMGIVEPNVAKERGDKAVQYLAANGINNYPGGTPTSLDEASGQQWDFPNAWPPLQDLLITALDSSGSAQAKELAEDLAYKWINSMVIGFNEEEAMFEKYDARTAGKAGGGGEYTTQTGFGWTNGAVLKLIERFYVETDSK